MGDFDWRLRSPFGDVEITLHPRSPLRGQEQIASERELVRLVHDFTYRDPQARRVVLDIYARLRGLGGGAMGSEGSDLDSGSPRAAAIGEELMLAARRGVLALRRREVRPVWVALEGDAEVVLGPEEPAETDWVGFQFVEDTTGAPVSGIKLAVTLPDGTSSTLTTADDGSAEIKKTVGGVCAVQVTSSDLLLSTTLNYLGEGGSPPPPDTPPAKAGKDKPKVARVVAHRMLEGETLGKVAQDNGLSLQALTKFNFETDDPKKLDRCVRLLTGCRARAGDDWAFAGTEDPGIVYVPQDLKLAGVKTGSTHVFRVAAVKPPLRPFLFSY
jgi:hypothetical protein